MGNHTKNTPHPNTNLYRTVGNHVVNNPVGYPYAPALLLLMLALCNYCIGQLLWAQPLHPTTIAGRTVVGSN